MNRTQPEINILIVDDRYDGILALQAVLGKLGHRLVTAASGADAIKRLEEREFALILLDVQMPLMDGFETAELIKQNPSWRHIPIVFVTAINKDERYVDRGYEAGAVDYLFKPFDAHILLAKTQVFVDLYRKSKEIEMQADLLRETERASQSQRLMQLEVDGLRRYQQLADSIPNIVCKTRADGSFDYFNRAWNQYTGLTAEQSAGEGWQSAFEPSDLRALLKTLIDSLLTGKDFQVECRIHHAASGGFRWNVVRGVAEFNAEGKVTAWLGTAVDIHDRKEWEVTLANAKEAAENANRAKSAFLANMSHEIRTPLNAIMGFSELLLDPEHGESSRAQCVSIVRRNGQQLMKIIDEILDLSKVEADRLEIENLPTDIEVLCNDLYSLFSVRALEQGLTFGFQVETPIPKVIRTDPTRLRQILNNIVGNALKFTKEGSVKVHLGFDERQEKLFLTVRDTGIGMPKDKVDRLFTPFSQIDNSTTRRFGGTGLGLALSRKLAQALGGDVALLKSAEGKGSVFQISIGTGDVKDAPFIRTIRVRGEEGKLPEKSELPKLNGVQVLLAEDAPDNQHLISRFLSMAGADVDLAANGLQAVEKASAKEYSLILMDIQMPILDGYEATRRLRYSGYQRPIVALTAHALKEERERCLESGCTDHLTKPVNRRELIEQVAFYAGL